MPDAASPELYAHVIAPIDIGHVRLRNRILVPAHTTNYGSDHLPSDRHLAYHRERARGGVGLIVFESIRVQQNCLGRPQAVGGFDRACIAPFARIGNAIRTEGAKLFGQVIHLGRQVDGDFERTASWGPSAARWSATSASPHAMTPDDMESVVDAHVSTALNLVEAGLDGIEVQMGHGHLLQQFLSPLSNRREDEWGGALANRLRFPLAVLTAVRRAVGPDHPLGIRISADEFAEGGLDLTAMCEIAPLIAEAVALDFVHVSHSAYHASFSLATQIADMGVDKALFRPLPGAIRRSLRASGHTMPVFAVCRYTTLAEAERTLAAGEADMVGMARAHIAEPALVRKTLAGRTDEIRTCIACNQGCAGMLEKNMAVRCLVNPRAGLEGLWAEPEDDPAARPRNVLVIGGGPAGMEAAAVAAARGHRVQLWERQGRLGGQLNQLRPMKGRREFLRLLDSQERRLVRHGVAVELGREARAHDVSALAPDLVVLATGSEPIAPALPGRGEVLTMEDALREPDRVGRDVAFLDLTGEWASLSAIEHLADLGRRVTAYSPVASFAWRTTIYSAFTTFRRLRDKGVKVATLRRARSWDGETLGLEDAFSGEVKERSCDTVILAQYNRASDGLRAPLAGAGLRVELVGDCLAPRTALEAVYEGHALARAI